MAVQSFGPADLYVIAFPTDHVPTQVREAIQETLASGVITLIDLVVLRRLSDGSTVVIELDNLGDELDLSVLVASGSGMIGAEDIDEIISEVDPGTSVLAILFENTWARAVAGAAAETGAAVISAERFPAAVVNEVAELAGIAALTH